MQLFHNAAWLVVCVILACPLSAQPVDYGRDVRPILADRCYACHGPDASHRMAGLRLDTPDGAAAAASKIYRRITAAEGSRMPPTGPSLTGVQQEIVRRWIAQGAKVSAHWAYIAPKRPEPAAVRDPEWPRNEIDRFILSRLDHEGLHSSAEAPKTTLIRRVSFDLTGLPPTPDEVLAFLNDRSPDAYEKVVDRLLASPHYGERMAVPWLDLARYADTHGYQIDSMREMWPWRDWVIRAFNRNMPFDQFTIEQLAGDLLPNATRDQQIATAFNRNHRINSEGGSLADEFQVEYVVDRVEATATTWLGTTLGCARCHDHKYDPFPQRDFYRFFAYFNHVPESGVGNAQGNSDPVLQLASAEQQQDLDRLTGGLIERERKLADPSVAVLLADWEKSKLPDLPPAPSDGLLAHFALDGSVSGRVSGGKIDYQPGPVGQAAEWNGVVRVATDVELSKAFSVALWEQAEGLGRMTVLRSGGFEMALDESRPMPPTRGAHLGFRIGGIEIRTRDRVTQKTWRHIAFTYDGSGKASGARVFVDGKQVACDVVRDALPAAGPPAKLEIGGSFHGGLDDLRIYSRPLTAAEVERLYRDEPVRAALAQPADKRDKDQAETLRRYFLTHDAPDDLRRLLAEYTSMLDQRAELNRSIPTVMVMKEMEKPRDTFVLGKGDYRNKGEKVTPGLPAALSPPSDAPADRLGLARWLVDPSNPLTARVAVNRFWAMCFGSGLVRTVEDFGSQGEPPTHPELLDWLATEFVRSGWDVKAILRLMVTSATYRQASAVTPALLEKDPENRLLARGLRFRMPAEMIRDNALAAAGLLDERIGGPSVFPYQPDGLWEETSVGDVYSAQVYTQSHGSDLYRRSLYTFWKRTVPAPTLAVFDAPDREKCTARRSLTSTPMQALTLLNDPAFVEAARALAQRSFTESDARRRAALLFRLATSREPSRLEAQVLIDLAARNAARYRKDLDAARKLLGVGEFKFDAKLDPAELAGWTLAASAVLNLDETITRK